MPPVRVPVAGRRNLRRLYTLFDKPEGATGRELDQIAEEIVEQARDNASFILHRLVAKHPEVLNTIQAVRRGNEIRIGIRPDMPAGTQNIGYYLAAKEEREHIWLTPAVEEVMNERKWRGRVTGGQGFG